MKIIISMLTSIIGIGCAVEAGNPATEDENGTIKIRFADETSESESFNLTSRPSLRIFVETIQLRGTSSDGTAIVSELTPVLSDIDLFDLEDAALVASETVASGTYDSIVVILNQNQPFRYLSADQEEQPLQFEDQESYSITIEQYFEVTGKDEEEVVIEFDSENSIVEDNENRFFKPKVRPHRLKEAVSYRSETDRTDGIVACAYAYGLTASMRPKRPENQSNGQLPPPPPGPKGERPKSFDSKEDLILDENSECQNAFSKANIDSSGSFHFRRLKPGTYSFRVFYEDETYEDIAEDIKLVPAEKPNL